MIEPRGAYLTAIAGLEVNGDVNVSGTYRINGVPITAFREAIIEKVVEGVVVEPRIIEQPKLELEAGDNVAIAEVEGKTRISADPGEWIEFVPHVSIEANAKGQYIVFGPICFVQMHILIDNKFEKNQIEIELPFLPYGPVKQSLNVGYIRGNKIVMFSQAEIFINGTYRIA